MNSKRNAAVPWCSALLGLVGLCTLFACRLAAASRDDAPPNIVVILADDLGYGDASPLNADSRIPTPALERLAREGMTFTDAHSPSAVCTPTRYGLVTGRYCWRSRLKSGVLNGTSASLIEPERPTVASFLRETGYATSMVGKWHLGLDYALEEDGQTHDYTGAVANSPAVLGFDYSYCIPASLDFQPYFYVHDGRIVEAPTVEQPGLSFPRFMRKGVRSPGFVPEDCLDHLLGKAVGRIAAGAADERPFFLYFALTAPHKPVWPHPRFESATELGPYGDFVTQVDWTVGQVLEALDEHGVAENTLILVTSDNGSFMHRWPDDDGRADHATDQKVQAYHAGTHRANHHLRGTKADIWEAGHRVPFFARWPGRVEAGSRSDTTMCLVDLFATCAELAGRPVPTGAAPDSTSFLPLLEGRAGDHHREPVIHHSANGTFALRDGDWKLIAGNGSGGREAPKGKPFGRPYMLFNLKDDPGERQDLAADRPELVEALEAKLEAIRARS